MLVWQQSRFAGLIAKCNDSPGRITAICSFRQNVVFRIAYGKLQRIDKLLLFGNVPLFHGEQPHVLRYYRRHTHGKGWI